MSTPAPRAADVGPDSGDLDRFVDLLERRDRSAAVASALTLADRFGVPLVITRLVGPAQVEVGARWEAGRWSVSQEHSASAIVEAVLDALASTAPMVAPHGRVVLTCVDGEWHSLPAKMFAALLRAQGWAVEFLGASVAAADLPDFLADADADAVALSCSVAMNLPGAARVVDAAHFAGLPVLVGGAALTESRSTALGADGYVRDAESASVLLHRWREGVVLASARRPGAHEAATLALSTPQIVDGVMIDLARTVPFLSSLTARQLAQVRADCIYVLKFLGAAVLIDDLGVYAEFLDWVQGSTARLGLPAPVLPPMLDALTGRLAPYPVARRFTSRGALTRTVA